MKDSKLTETPPGSLQQPDSAIVHRFKLKLTKQQQTQLERLWNKHGKMGGAIIMQPVLNLGPFRVRKAVANSAIVNEPCFLALNEIISAAHGPNDPSSATASTATPERKGDS